MRSAVAFAPMVLAAITSAVILAAGVFGRPMVGPAEVPADRLKILRSAYLSALKDPELKAEAEKRGFEMEPVAGQELT